MKQLIFLIALISSTMTRASAQKGQYTMVNGLHMYYEIHGQGRPLVLIHGAASTIQSSFGRLIPELEKDHKIIAVELQAHGHSDNRDGRQITFEQDADDVAALLEQLHIDNADVMGFSNGGTSALQMAIRHPKLVHRLIFASSMYKRAGVPKDFWEGMKHGQFEDMPDGYKKEFLSINHSDAALHIMFEQCLHRMQHFTDIPDSVVAAVQQPTLIILGDKDVPTPEHGVEMYRLMPHASLAILPGGHGGYMGEMLTLSDGH
ncbi:MAG: alpha/beta hydrolase, partial [Bacteroidetes bacterium]|nr:alpha/beta hydrolase [Bacteroidota bacterium]